MSTLGFILRIRLAFVWLVLVLILAGVFFKGIHSNEIRFESDILKLLPASQVDPFTEKAFERFSNRNIKKLFFLLEHESLEKAKQASDLLRASLHNMQGMAQVGGDISADDQQKIGRFNFDFRHQLLSNKDRELLHNKQYQVFIDDVIEQAYSPFSAGLLGLLKDDPFLLSYRYATALGQSKPGNLTLDGDHLVSVGSASNYVLVNATLANSPFDAGLQQALATTLAGVTQAWNQAGLADVKLYRTGAVFYATHAAAKARGEIAFFGGLSITLIVLLVLVVFFSLKPLAMTTLALLFGVATGFAAVQTVFGSVHLLTLVFGASLIGISVDYAFHFFASKGKTGEQRIKRIFPAITIGVFSSMVGYLVLLTTPFPGLQQMGTFCIAGLFGAYLTVVLLFPILNLEGRGHNKCLPLCSRLMQLGEARVARRLWQLLLISIPVAILLLIGDSHEQSDVRAFQPKNVELQQQEAVIQSVLNNPAMNQFYLVKGQTPNELMEHLEAAETALKAKQQAGIIGGYIALSQWLPSEHKQEYHASLIRELIQSGVHEQLVELGLITRDQFESYKAGFIESRTQLLLATQWLASPMGKQTDYLWLGRIGEEYAAIIPLLGVKNLEALGDLNSATRFVDKVNEVNGLLDTYRVRTTWMFFAAIAAIYGVLLARMGLRKGTVVMSLPLIAVSVAILAIVVSGSAITLFNVVALFLVAGIGVDYAVFFAEMKQESANTLLAVALSALTTLFSFGMLTMSETLVISTFGFTVLIGICAAFLLSPIVARLTRGVECE